MFLTCVTSGMAPLIRAVLSNLIGEEAAKTIDIIANEAEVKPDGKWELKFRHPTRYVVPFPWCNIESIDGC